MKVSCRRLARLGAGVSLAALAVGSPAIAATAVSPGISHVDINDPAGDTLTICLVDDDCFFGTEADGAGSVSALLNDVPSGRIEQIGLSTAGDVNLSTVNHGNAEIAAHATAAISSGFASANAFLLGGVFQSGTGPGDIALNLSNDGTLLIDAVAKADPGNTAFAHASLTDGILQTAFSTGGDASVKLSNDGALNIAAVAVGTGTAFTATSHLVVGPSGTTSTTSQLVVNPVHAGIRGGISQTAVGRDASANLTNSGTIALDANAVAEGDSAFADANIDYGIGQFASGATAATDALTNTKSINLDANAAANAATGIASAHAAVTYGIQQVAQFGEASASLDNSGSIDIAADVVAAGEQAKAVATLYAAISQDAQSFGYDAQAELTNSSSIELTARGKATAIQSAALTSMQMAGSAIVQAHASSAINQMADAKWGNADLSLTNSGTIAISANAAALAVMTGTATRAGLAAATASLTNAIFQDAFALAGDAKANMQNSGSLNFAAAAQATGADAFAGGAVGSAVYQQAHGSSGDAFISLDNSGKIQVAAKAVANGSTGLAIAEAAAPDAILQLALEKNGDASVSLTNSGTIDVNLSADAKGTFQARGMATAGAVAQIAVADSAGSASFDNRGTIDVTAFQRVDTDFGLASGHIQGVGLLQDVESGSQGLASAKNEGTIDVHAAETHTGGFAITRGLARGVVQFDEGGALELANSGKIDVALSEKANGTLLAQGVASVTGVLQSHDPAKASFDNSGILSVAADVSAQATGPLAAFFVNVQGYQVGPTLDVAGIDGQVLNPAENSPASVGANGSSLELDVNNSGKIDVTAQGQTSGGGGTNAKGIVLIAEGLEAAPINDAVLGGTVENSGEVKVASLAKGSVISAYAVGMDAEAVLDHADPTVALVLDFDLVNSGDLLVGARAVGDGSFSVVTGSGSTQRTIMLNGSTAYADGVSMSSGVNTSRVTNSGSIVVEAFTVKGGPAIAKGIVVENGGVGAPAAASDVFTVNNSGEIVARQSTDGAKTWQRGYAIDVANAPNASAINLLGGGKLYGNVDIKDGDVINVTGGTTSFDGIVNPECVGAGDLNGCGQGALNINNGGRLVLEDPRFTGDPTMYDGPSYAFVNTLDLRAPSGGSAGTIAFGLEPAAGGAQAAGTYSQVFADTANLAGTLEAWFAPKDGLFADSYSWDNLIQANTVNGKFDQCSLGGAYANSPLLQLSCSYDNSGNVDLALTRVAFDKVGGLNRNAAAAGAFLESMYATDLTGGVANLVGDLFRADNAADYNSALNMLSGSSYANYLQSFGSLAVHDNDLVDRATDCDEAALSGAEDCRSEKVRLWAQADDQKRKVDGDSGAGAVRSNRWSVLVGADASLGKSAIIGATFGSLTNHVRDRQFGDDLNGGCYTFGLYGVYDPGAFFVKGMGGYSELHGKSSRRVDLTSGGGTFAGTVSGSPDVSMWTAGLHAGYRRQVGKASLFTSYVNLDFADARLNGFNEARQAGDPGAELGVSGGTSRHLFLTSGLKWTGRIGGIVPELNLGVRHRFGDKRSQFSVDSLGGEDASFKVVSAGQKRDSLLAGVSVGGKLAGLDLRLSYEGEYNGRGSSQSANLRISLPLGGQKAH